LKIINDKNLKMRLSYQKITIINLRKSPEKNLNKELQWFGTSLGLFNLRDKDKSLFRVFIELLKSTKSKKPLSSEELALRLNLARGTVIHHINKLISSGIVITEGSKYTLRVDNLKELVTQLEKDIKRTCEELKEVADHIDKKLGL
jgi:predicted transcriptional regulator